MYRSLKPPTLEMGKATPHLISVKKAFNHIERTPLCWLAHEDLEEFFDGNSVCSGLTFHVINGKIVFIADTQKEPVAVVHFDQAIGFERPKITTIVEPSENMSVRRNRKPIRYSLGYLKEKLSRVRRR
ncbi:hypothetical protein LVD17_00125 [Fulvivirga ulvae]|uniref:hypothetical protein n=1 Tax=Fulvivirga ulvae TaxID=2904245 RepID=UPI001F3009C0|nr:hypothetical protein [Fulvivirga ulvae]UII32209.1 hypothetical protein LVD17_28390 [Fulvivirga ulvae]UII32242.1 hypothetical protein LVD17_00125 [Fulvivirga ulvae]